MKIVIMLIFAASCMVQIFLSHEARQRCYADQRQALTALKNADIAQDHAIKVQNECKVWLTELTNRLSFADGVRYGRMAGVMFPGIETFGDLTFAASNCCVLQTNLTNYISFIQETHRKFPAKIEPQKFHEVQPASQFHTL